MLDRARARCRASRAKRTFDRTAAGMALVGLSPVIGGIALWIRCAEGRPVLFRQDRAGVDGAPFAMLKFRTMVNGAVALASEWGLTDDPYGIVDNDPRITRSGRFLRRSSLDELPQLVNVLRGQMSLVGPRPDVLDQVELYNAEERRRLDVRPGITGWVQVNGRDELPWEQRFPLDRWYIDNWSLRLDARILWMTVRSIGREEPPAVEDDFHLRRRQQVAGA